MNSNSQNKIIINIDDNKYINWELCLKNELEKIKSSNIEIDCKNLDLTCKDILEIVEITTQHNCKIISFLTTSSKTAISSQSLGYTSHFIDESFSKKALKINQESLNFSKAHFHEGTLRSGEYLESPGDLLILGDVNPGAKVSAEGNIIIWGRLLGIAHAGTKGNSQATISALQLRPVQLRIAKKVARGPKDKPQLGLAEQAKIDSEEIIITPLETT